MACKSDGNSAVLAPDNKRQISFGMSKICQMPTTRSSSLSLCSDLIQGEFRSCAPAHRCWRRHRTDAAQALIDRGLSMTQLQLLKGPITARTKNLPQGTETDTKAESMLKNLTKTK